LVLETCFDKGGSQSSGNKQAYKPCFSRNVNNRLTQISLCPKPYGNAYPWDNLKKGIQGFRQLLRFTRPFWADIPARRINPSSEGQESTADL